MSDDLSDDSAEMALPLNQILNCDVLEGLKKLPDESVDMVITSPPYYGLRRYLNEGDPNEKQQIGLEPTFNEFLDKMMEVMKEIKRVVKRKGLSG